MEITRYENEQIRREMMGSRESWWERREVTASSYGNQLDQAVRVGGKVASEGR